MGTADVVPGVSGGTMAVALGIYHRLLAAVTSINREAIGKLVRLKLPDVFALVHWRFLASLLGGVGLGVVLMVKVVKLPLLVGADSLYRPLVYAIFFGMVLGSVFTLSRHLEAWRPQQYGALVFGAGLGFAIVNLVPVGTPDHAAFIFFAGAVAICAMLLPGISGSFILLILGKYAYILGAVGELKLGVILPFVLGCAVGILSFSRLLKWLLERWHDAMLAGLIGLLVGSLWRIWPYQHLETVVVRHKPRVIKATPFLPESLDFSLLGGFVAGVVFVVGLEIYASKRKAAADTALKPNSARAVSKGEAS
jgi:putative membrane protein